MRGVTGPHEEVEGQGAEGHSPPPRAMNPAKPAEPRSGCSTQKELVCTDY